MATLNDERRGRNSSCAYDPQVSGRLYAGTAGFSYRTWRGSFYPAEAKSGDLLRLYAERLPSVELVGVFYRIPPPETFARWAAETPADFRFGVKMNRRIALYGDLALAPAFAEAVATLGTKLGPIRIQLSKARDDAFLHGLFESLPAPLKLAFELEHESWHSPEVDEALADAGAVRVNDLDAAAPFRYLRLREPPYSYRALTDLAARLRLELDHGTDVYCYFKHEDEPRGALYAERLLRLMSEEPRGG